MDIKQIVARRIKVARAERGLNQADLGELMHVNQKLISRFESGRVNIGIETLQRIAAALQKPLTYFLEPFEDVPNSTLSARATSEKKASYKTSKKSRRQRDLSNEPAR
jgi:HTH-type transcriptional regulator / antitoxin HipB